MALERKAGFQSAIATDAGDTAAGYLTPDRYNLAHTVAGADVGSIPYFPTATTEASSGMTWNASAAAGEGLASAAGTATTDVKSYSATQTWNNSGVTFTAFKQNITDTASNAASLLLDLQVGSSSKFKIRKDGMITSPLAGNMGGVNPQNYIILNGGFSGYGIGFGANGDLAVVISSAFKASIAADVILSSTGAHIWTNSSQATDTRDTSVVRAAANSVRWGGGTPTATTTSRTEINKAVASIADNTATATFTVTVPNAAHSAMLKVTLVGSLGAGGAVGANEATGTISYDFAIARTAGVATVVTASTAYGSSTSSVAGAATITVTAAASAMTGANSATQTFTVNVTIAKGSGSSDNHTCLCYGRLLNANVTGVTIS